MHLSRSTVAVAAASTLALSACGNSTPSTGGGSASAHSASLRTPYARVIAASDSTSKLHSAAVAITGRIAVAGRTVEVTGSGVFDLVQHVGTMTLSSPLLKGSIDARIIGSTLYEKLPGAIGKALPGGKQWIKLDLAKAAAASGVSSPFSSDPTASLQQLKAASTSVKDLGPATVRGVSTEHYLAQVDLAKASKSPQATAQLRRVLGTTMLPVDTYVDAQGMLRRITETIKGAPSGAAPGLSETISLELYDLNTATVGPVTAPPADQTYDVTSKLGSMRFGGVTA